MHCQLVLEFGFDEIQIVEHFSSSSKLITWTISNFANFKYFGNLFAITYEKARDP
jgi:hypothetical protein